MIIPVVYLAHQVAGAVDLNIVRALRWYSWITEREKNIALIMPWLADVTTGNDSDPVRRERGLRDCETVVARCDGIVLCGDRVSSGMQRELDVAVAKGLWVSDLTCMGAQPVGERSKPIEFGRSMWIAKQTRQL